MTDPWVRQLTKPQRERLKRHECWLCHQRLDRGGCNAIYQTCTEEDRRNRAAACLRASRKLELRDATKLKPTLL